MKKKIKKNLIGRWSFLIGIVAAVTIGIFSAQVDASTYNIVLLVLILLGIILGLFNVTNKESNQFLLAGLSLVIVSFIGKGILMIIPEVGKILSSLLVLFVPATIVVALKSVFDITKD